MTSQHIIKGFAIVIILAAAFSQHLVQAQQQPVPPSNLQVLHGLSRPQIIQVMNDWATALGVDCNYCHQASYEAETPRKHITRFMQREYVNTFRRQDGKALSCQDCHQGNAKILAVRATKNHTSSDSNSAFRFLRVKLKSTGVMLWRGSSKVGFLPKKKFMERMRSFNQALGVACSYCHKKGDYEAETPARQSARFMMEAYNGKLIRAEGQSVSCKDCHQGQAKPLAHFKLKD